MDSESCIICTEHRLRQELRHRDRRWCGAVATGARGFDYWINNARGNGVYETGDDARFGEAYLTRGRLGQGAFRVLVADAYQRRCAVTGERTLPVLEAAHIKPYGLNGPHWVRNGILLRSDLHKLFDLGYVTVTPDLRLEVSRRLKAEWENGREYYAYHGRELSVRPSDPHSLPGVEFLRWHNEQRFKA